VPLIKYFLEFDYLVDNELGDADDVGLLINCQSVDPNAKLLGEKKRIFPNRSKTV